MSDIVDSLKEDLKREKRKEVGYEEIRKLINNYKTSENPLTDLAKEIKRIKKREGYKATSITYPTSWETLLKEFKELGERETGFKNLSLMVNIAIIEFLLRHKSNPQPKLTDSIGLRLPSTIRENFSQEFRNYLRNLPKERARDVMLKNAKYLTLRAVGEKEEEETKEKGEKTEHQKELKQWAEKKKQEMKRQIMKKLDKAEDLKRKGKDSKAEKIINSVKSRKFEEVKKRIKEINKIEGNK